MTKDDILDIAKERMTAGDDADRENALLELDDLRFATNIDGAQWDEKARTLRESEGKPCLTINAMPQYVRQVTGQIRSLNPAVKVMPGDGDASKDVAEVIEGLIRHIEYACDASAAYEGAGESAAMGGRGAFRVRADYINHASFEQELLIERIFNPLAVVWDPMAKKPTRADAEWVFIREAMTRKAFEAAYPKAGAESVSSSVEKDMPLWYTSDTVTIAEYIWKDYTDKTIWLLEDGTTVDTKPKQFKRERKTRTCKIMWVKLSGKEILEGPLEIPGVLLPVIAVMGEEVHIGETVYRSSVIRHAKDPARLLNYSRSAHAELVALQTKAPYMVTPEQIAGHEGQWNNPQANRMYMTYNADPEAGAPKREAPPQPSGGLMAEVQMSIDDLKRTTGIYDAGLGARSNETSGTAINARKEEAQNATSIYADNVAKAVAQCGRVLCGMIPTIYDTERTIRILGEDDQEKMVVINGVFQDAAGESKMFDMKAGTYDIRIGVGPNYSTKRQASLEGMIAFSQAVPESAALIGDLIAKSSDWPDADRIAERLKKALPPGMIEQDDMKPEEVQAAQQAQQAAMQEQQAMAQAQQAMQAIAMDEAKGKADEANAKARLTDAEAGLKELELAAANGQIKQMMDQHVDAGIHGALQGAFSQ